jgi:hypothetical protein
MVVFVAGELRRSYAELPLRWLLCLEFARFEEIPFRRVRQALSATFIARH